MPSSSVSGAVNVGVAQFQLPSTVLGTHKAIDACVGRQGVSWSSFPSTANDRYASDITNMQPPLNSDRLLSSVSALSLTNSSGHELSIQGLSQNISITFPLTNAMSSDTSRM